MTTLELWQVAFIFMTLAVIGQAYAMTKLAVALRKANRALRLACTARRSQ